MNLFPFSGLEENITEEQNNELPPLKEIAIDFKTGNPIIENREVKTVEGVEALKVWIYKALKSERFVYKAYTQDFGNEMYMLFGRNYTQALVNAEAKRYAKEALEINPYIKEVVVKSINFNKDKLTINLDVESVFGNMEFAM